MTNLTHCFCTYGNSVLIKDSFESSVANYKPSSVIA
jgi:hypothetical protein